MQLGGRAARARRAYGQEKVSMELVLRILIDDGGAAPARFLKGGEVQKDLTIEGCDEGKLKESLDKFQAL